jgi:hypothetical protein
VPGTGKKEVCIYEALPIPDPVIAWTQSSLSFGSAELPVETGNDRIIHFHEDKYRKGAHTKHDLKVHLVWIPKYRKKILTGPVAVRVRGLIRQIAMEHEIEILSGKVGLDHQYIAEQEGEPIQDDSGLSVHTFR